MAHDNLPKVLIVGRNNWTTDESTLSSVFGKYDPNRLAYIYIETTQPNTPCCNSFFQISEVSLLRKLLLWNTKTGREIAPSIDYVENEQAKHAEQGIMAFVRRYRLPIFGFARDFLWYLNGWKSKELDEYIDKIDPDVVFCVEIPLPLLIRLQRYVIKKAHKPAVIFFMDDFYSLKAAKGPMSWLSILHTRRGMIRLLKECSAHFAISPLMKSVYDKMFGIKCEILTKSIDFISTNLETKKTTRPIRLVYMGNTYYHRDETLSLLVDTLQELNNIDAVFTLSMYITNKLTNVQRKQLCISGVSKVLMPVPYSQVGTILKENDIVVFAESFEKHVVEEVKLSFSTKLVDYMASGRAILAIGPRNIAPIDYLKSNDAAFVASSKAEIKTILQAIVRNDTIVGNYAEKAFACAQKNHEANDMHSRLIKVLQKLKD